MLAYLPLLVFALPTLFGLIAWWLWLRFARHVHDESGPDALKTLPPVARAFPPGTSRLPLRPRRRRAGGG